RYRVRGVDPTHHPRPEIDAVINLGLVPQQLEHSVLRLIVETRVVLFVENRRVSRVLPFVHHPATGQPARRGIALLDHRDRRGALDYLAHGGTPNARAKLRFDARQLEHADTHQVDHEDMRKSATYRRPITRKSTSRLYPSSFPNSTTFALSAPTYA